ncbi:MAG: hypothetical protein V1689_04240 [Pseudomonadota bacterium]
MSTEKLRQVIGQMEPREAASAISLVLKDLFSVMDERDRVQFVVNLLGNSGNDKVASLVHL